MSKRKETILAILWGVVGALLLAGVMLYTVAYEMY